MFKKIRFMIEPEDFFNSTHKLWVVILADFFSSFFEISKICNIDLGPIIFSPSFWSELEHEYTYWIVLPTTLQV